MRLMEPEVAQAAARGGVAVTGATFATMSPNEIVSLIAGALTAIYVVAQLITLTPKMLDAIAELRRRMGGSDESS